MHPSERKICKQVLIEVGSGEDPLMLKLDHSENRVERSIWENGHAYLGGSLRNLFVDKV